MKNLAHINLLLKHLQKKKDDHIHELKRIMALLNRKNDTLHKMHDYQAEYQDVDQYKLSKAMPSMNKNLDMFLAKVADAIDKTRDEIELIDKSKQIYASKVNEITKKIDMLNGLITKLHYQLAVNEDAHEQSEIDDMIGKNNDG